ncbi:MAG: DUF4301 family protein [Bacteroidales bacterium]|nr:DUF4301 family protein [Bacteroidales bacterium]
MFSEKDLQQISAKGIRKEEIMRQTECFKKGFPFVVLDAPAINGNGIKVFSKNETDDFCRKYDKYLASGINVIKFVPASGAATRMFKTLFSFTEWYKNTEYDYEKYLSDKSFNSVFNFISNIEKFAFYDDLKNALKQNNSDVDICLKEKKYNEIINCLLRENGLEYGNLPKGLLKFHKYENYSRTSLEEHLVEGANYCKCSGNSVNIHFTFSPEHIEKFVEHIDSVLPVYEKMFNAKFIITYSVQKSSTDTVAVDMKNELFREKDGSVHFRPAGHGALLENLNDLKGEIVFIKNIDNIVPDIFKETTYIYKKVLAGYLLEIREKIKNYLQKLETNVQDKTIDEIKEYAVKTLCLNIPEYFYEKEKEEKKEYLFHMLNRPVRICGMVKNEGEPGGGPFWVKDKNGQISLQIVETSQVNMNDNEQREIYKASTHFNPVDLVCSVRNYKNTPFNLLDFTNPDTGFISLKSKDGKEIKALELPGLWNGAMAKWITIFAEVPLITFNPVKTINDLLRKEHLNQ